MKILVVCQYYWPEPLRITNICEELVRRGHEVFVISGVPNYPQGEVYGNYKHGQRRDEVLNGVHVHRCFTLPRKSGALHRALNYYSYAISSWLYANRLQHKFDVVFINQLSPVMMAKAGIRYAKRHHKKAILYCLDLWPESLVTGGIRRDSWIYRYYRSVSKKIYSQMDSILVTSKMFQDYFQDMFGIGKEKIRYVPQYAENLFSPEMCEKKADNHIDLLFAGNIGIAQSVETIIRAANETRDIKNLRWHIVGEGSDLENCKALAEKLDIGSVVFHGRKPLEEMPKFYAMADAMLVTMQNNPVLSLTLPGKIQTYMAAGKPIIGAINGETAKLILDAQCGICVEAEDFLGLAFAVRSYCSNHSNTHFAENSLAYYEQFFSQEAAFTQLEDALKQCSLKF